MITKKQIAYILTEDEDEDLTMDDLPDYDTPELPDQEDAEYDGREVTLYDPFRIEDDEKKFAVYVRNPDSGNVNKVKFGSDTMEIKRDDPARLKSFRSRFSCGDLDQSDKHTAKFWSCVFWRKDKSVSDLLSEGEEWKIEEYVRSATRNRILEKASEEYCKNTDPEDMGFTQRASCKAQGYIERSSGEKKKSDKYKESKNMKRINSKEGKRQIFVEELRSLQEQEDREETTVGEVINDPDMILVHPRSPQYSELIRQLRDELGTSSFNPSSYEFYIVNQAEYDSQAGHGEVYGGYVGRNYVADWGKGYDQITDENKIVRLV
jgi:hypothetical protein